MISESPYEHTTIFGLPFFENYFVEFNNEGNGSVTLGLSEMSQARVIDIWPAWLIALIAIVTSAAVIGLLVLAWRQIKKRQFEKADSKNSAIRSSKTISNIKSMVEED